MLAVVFFGLISIISFYIIGITAYLLLLSIGACFFTKKVSDAGKPLTIAVVIPAHNEEGHIETTVGHIRRSDYPAAQYAVFVIADNCTDRTEERARRAGARVFARTDLARRGNPLRLPVAVKIRMTRPNSGPRPSRQSTNGRRKACLDHSRRG